MTQEEIFKKITDVIVAKLEVKAEDVKMESEFGNDLGADSLDRVRRLNSVLIGKATGQGGPNEAALSC